MTIQINNVEMPESMRNRALNYLYLPGTQVARNGLGEIILAGGGIVTWTWAQLNQEEFAWWVTTILEGEPSKEISGTPGIIVLYDDIHQEQRLRSRHRAGTAVQRLFGRCLYQRHRTDSLPLLGAYARKRNVTHRASLCIHGEKEFSPAADFTLRTCVKIS